MAHKPVKMVIWRDKEGGPCCCPAESMATLIEPGDEPITIDKVFNALSNWDVGQTMNAHLNYGEYNKIEPDCYLDDGAERYYE
jgi:hypothetical protein